MTLYLNTHCRFSIDCRGIRTVTHRSKAGDVRFLPSRITINPGVNRVTPRGVNVGRKTSDVAQLCQVEGRNDGQPVCL